MIIVKIGKSVYKGAANVGKKLIPKKLCSTFDGVLSKPPKSDVFIKEADDVVPKKLQAVLETFSRHEGEKKEFYTRLYKLGEEKFDLIRTNEYLSRSSFFFCKDSFLKAIDKLSPKQLSQTFDEVVDLYKTLPKVDFGNGLISQIPDGDVIAKLTVLKSYNNEAYQYILNHNDKELVSDFLKTVNNRLNGEVFETLTVPQIRQITGEGCINTLKYPEDTDLITDGYSAFTSYVSCSDAVASNAEKSRILSRYLSKSKITEPFSAFRGERDTGMFDSIILDKKLALKTRFYILKSFYKARKVPVHDYTGEYETSFAKKTDLLHYILGKDDLTLADAMQVAKYGSESYKNEIIELIKKSKVSDTRFKSLTFDSGMARSWAGMVQGSRNTGILHDLSVDSGLEGIYSYVNNRQAEFVLNNSQKYMTFQDAVYDAERDVFRLRSHIGLE